MPTTEQTTYTYAQVKAVMVDQGYQMSDGEEVSATDLVAINTYIRSEMYNSGYLPEQFTTSGFIDAKLMPPSIATAIDEMINPEVPEPEVPEDPEEPEVPEDPEESTGE